MTTKDDFSAEEWAQVAPLAGMVLGGAVLADGRKVISSVREVVAGSEALKKGAEKYPNNVLLTQLVESGGKMKLDSKPSSTEAALSEISSDTQQAWTLLQSKATPEESAQISEVLLSAAQAAVERTGSGHFGMGGEKVDSAEQSYMDKLTATLSVSAGSQSADADAGSGASEASDGAGQA